MKISSSQTKPFKSYKRLKEKKVIFLPKQLKKSSFLSLKLYQVVPNITLSPWERKLYVIMRFLKISFGQRKPFQPYARLSKEKSDFSAKTAQKT